VTGIYIHIPYCKQKCRYCSFVSSFDTSSIPVFLIALEKEIDCRRGIDFSKNKPPIDTIYIGGGTPSILPKIALNRIFAKIQDNFTVQENSEITIEVNPESLTEEFLTACVNNGVNRLSIGLQSHDDKILRYIGRKHTQADFERAIELIQTSGITNVSVDLILGLPNQTKQSLLESIEIAAKNPIVKHLSLYALTLEENTELYKLEFAPDPDIQATMYEDAVEVLKAKRFVRYEVSNFALKGFGSKHNQKYWIGEEYLGFGAAAHSFLPKENVRIENNPNIAQYNLGKFEDKREAVPNADRIKEIIMLQLRTASGLNLKKLKNDTGWDLEVQKAVEINDLKVLKLLVQKKDILYLSPHAYYLLDSILMKLL